MFSVYQFFKNKGYKKYRNCFSLLGPYFQSDVHLWHCVISLQMPIIFSINSLNANHDCNRGKNLWYVSWLWSKIRLDISCESSAGPADDSHGISGLIMLIIG